MRDPYLYPDIDVLKNKKNIKDQKELDKLEEDIVPLRMIKLRMEGLAIESVFDIQKIHNHLFSPLFDWAGEFRTITMYKKEPILDGASVDYTPAPYIKEEMNALEQTFKAINWKKLSTKGRIKKVSAIVQELWQIHCFREGNTRTTALFLYFLLKTLGIHINVEFLGENAKYFRNALVVASLYGMSRPEFLLGIIQDATTFKNIDTGKYESINGYEIKKYAYQNHTIEKIKTIKGLEDLELK